jgi:hypothetical protein
VSLNIGIDTGSVTFSEKLHSGGVLFQFVIQVVHPFALYRLGVPRDRAPICVSELRFVSFSLFLRFSTILKSKCSIFAISDMPLANTKNRFRTGSGCFDFVCAAAGALVPLAPLVPCPSRVPVLGPPSVCRVVCVLAVVGSVVGGGRASLVLGPLVPVCGPLVSRQGRWSTRSRISD